MNLKKGIKKINVLIECPCDILGYYEFTQVTYSLIEKEEMVVIDLR